jgi:ribosomal-protein-alanine N-acetyltransferase
VITTASEAGGIVVRQATRADLLEVFQIEQRSFPQPWPFAAFERFLGTRGFLVVEADGPIPTGDGEGTDLGAPGEIAGYVVADTVPNHGRPLGHIKDLAVHPDRRGEGLGRTLMERALGVLRGADAETVKLEVRRSNEAARSLYEAYDFVHRRTVPGYYDDGEDALVMMRDLD